MSHIYSFPLEVDIGEAIDSVGKLVKGVNKAMASFGFEEKMILRNIIGYSDLTSDRPLSPVELAAIRDMLQSGFDEKMAHLKAHVGEPISKGQTPG